MYGPGSGFCRFGRFGFDWAGGAWPRTWCDACVERVATVFTCTCRADTLASPAYVRPRRPSAPPCPRLPKAVAPVRPTAACPERAPALPARSDALDGGDGREERTPGAAFFAWALPCAVAWWMPS